MGIYQDGIQLGAPALVEGGVMPCDRCGDFALLHWNWDKRLCAECLARRHPVLTTPRRASALLIQSVKLLPVLGWRGILTPLSPLPFVLVVRWLKPASDTGDIRRDALRDMGPDALIAPSKGLVTALVTCLLLQVLIEGTAPDFRAAWAKTRSRLFAIAGMSITLVLLDDVAIAFAKLLGTALVWIPFALAYPIMLQENASVPLALRRSSYRMRGNYGAVIGITLVYAMLLAIVAVGVFIVIRLIKGHADSRLLGTLADGMSEFLTLPFTVASAVLYVKLPPRIQR